MKFVGRMQLFISTEELNCGLIIANVILKAILIFIRLERCFILIDNDFKNADSYK